VIDFTKTATTRLILVAGHVVRPTHSIFMEERIILDGLVTLHETFHELHQKNLIGVILMINFEKAYDKFKWSFLQ
jgi:hypothetical protein